MVVEEQIELKESIKMSEGDKYYDQSEHDLVYCNEQKSDEDIPACSWNDPSEFPVLGTPVPIHRCPNTSRNLKMATSESLSQMVGKKN